MALFYRSNFTLLAYIASVLLTLAAADSEQQDFTFVGRVIETLNDCSLPTIQEVDEVNQIFVELRNKYGNSYREKLSEDMKIAQETLLDQWEVYHQKVAAEVFIRSVAKRIFLNKVSAYVKAKFGEEGCKPVEKPDINKIFIKNAYVRYGQLMEEKYQSLIPPQPELRDYVIHTPIVDDSDSDKIGDESAVTTETSITTISTTAELPTESPNLNDEQVDEETKDDFHDPIADVPVPPAVDNNQPSEPDLTNLESDNYEVSTVKPDHQEEELEAITEAPTTTTTTTEPPIEPESESDDETEFDEYGAELVDVEYDDEDLDRLNVRNPKQWEEKQFNQFQWPDEPMDELDKEEYDPTIRDNWYRFLKNPDSVYEFMLKPKEHEESTENTPSSVTQEPTVTEAPATMSITTEEPEDLEHPDEVVPDNSRWRPSKQLTAAALRRKKKEYIRLMEIGAKIEDDSAKYGWNKYPDAMPGYVPRGEVLEKPKSSSYKSLQESKNSGGWINVADNSHCKISVDKDSVTGKKAIKALKKMFRPGSGQRWKSDFLVKEEF